jgi:hypothetical protein
MGRPQRKVICCLLEADRPKLGSQPGGSVIDMDVAGMVAHEGPPAQ